MLVLLFLMCFSASLSYFLDYALGFPMSDNPNEKSIFYGYTAWVAKKSMPKSEIELTKSDTVRQAKVMGGAWIYPLGYCAVCSNIWVSLILFSITQAFIRPLPYFTYPVLSVIVYAFIVMLGSHYLLRKHLL